MWTCAGVLALVACASALTRDQFYPNGPGLDQSLPKGSEVPSPEYVLRVPIKFYGDTYESIFINNFGVLTFRADLPTFLNIEFPLPYPSISAFYTNIDTTYQGVVYYRETDESHVLYKAEEGIQDNFHAYYDFKPRSVFIATWLDVTYASNITSTNPKNSFQVAIISNGTETFVELLYPERDIQWFEKLPQIPSHPDAKAQAGFVSEDGRVYELRGSGTHQIRNIVSWTNTNKPGQYIFRVGNIPPDANIVAPDAYNKNEIEIQEESKTCAQSGPSVCHIEARCVDYSAGICCQCRDGYYGNGKSCIKIDVPLRVHGKINGIVNHQHLDDVDIQAYVVVAEGRTYTALSQVPGGLGSSLQLLNVLGGVIGWLFALSSNPAKNGYQLTGSLFNHTADIWFPGSNDRVTINQEYLGHDVFDQITLEADIRGSVPVILAGTKLEVSEYEEKLTLVEPGRIRSQSSRTFTNKITGEKIEQRVSQIFTFSACLFAPSSDVDKIPSTLKVTKNYLGFETHDNIVRYGMTNKIYTEGHEDPCNSANKCGSHSTCVAQADSYVCICQTGFTNAYQEDLSICIDIDECQAGTHNCDNNADCHNYAGGFQCACRAGFTGNGIRCNLISGCYNKICHENARCVENGREASCICNSGFYGDGQFCIPALDFPKEADYNETFVLPTCDSSSCSCPPGYSDYRDNSNNQLCRLNDYNASPQQPTNRPYPPPTEPPYSFPNPYHQQGQENYPQNNYDPNFNYQYNLNSPPLVNHNQDASENTHEQSLDNEYNQSSENTYQQPSDVNYEQSSNNNYPQPPDNTYQQSSDNNYPQPPDNTYQQPSDNNYPQPPDNTYQQPTDNNYPQAPDNTYQQSSDNNYPQPPDNTYQQSSDNNYPQSPDNTYQQSSDNNYPQPPDNTYQQSSDNNYPQPPDNTYQQSSDNTYQQSTDNNYPQSLDNNYPQPSDNTYQQSADNGYPQPSDNNYPQPSDDNYPQPSDNNYPQPSDNNYSQSTDNNYQVPSENQYQRPSDNNYPQPSDTYYEQSSNNYYQQASQNNYGRPSPDNNYQLQGNNYPQTSERNYDQTPSTNYQSNYAHTTTESADLISCYEDADCPPNAICSLILPQDEERHCTCPEGYEGDAFECIERTIPSCNCGLRAHCVSISTRANEYICVCDAGYHGDGYVCRPNFSCKNNSDCEYNADCKPDEKTGEYICQCVNGFIKDQNDACIPDAQLCNGARCAEHASCLYDTDMGINYCNCNDGFSGIGISECVATDQSCHIIGGCSPYAVCTPLEETYACICREGYSGDGYTCVIERSCKSDPNMCDLHASCLKRNDAYVCECNTGYNGNGTICELNPRQAGNFLVASDGASIYKVPFRTTPRNFATPFNSGVSQIAVGIDVDCEVGTIYWGDVVSYAIKTSRYDGSDANLFLSDGVKSPEGIAIDWSARNIFWTDSKKLTIEVANLDTKARKVLFAVDNISNPRGIAVHPQRGKIFWSDWKRSNPKIEWANMDGSQRGVFLDKNDVVLPNSLAIDWLRDRLCFADAGLFSIKCIGIDTLEEETIASNCSYPFGLAIYGRKFYWTDWKTLKIEYVDTETQIRGQVPIATASRRLYGVAVAPEECQPLHSVCMYRNGGCNSDQLCLPDGNNGRTCVNADNTFNVHRRRRDIG